MKRMTTTTGVNLGGWLVVEKWMTPSLFAGIDASNEYELSQSKIGRKRLRQHHNYFITEDDICWLYENGITLLRVPIGYWIFGGEDPYQGAMERLDWLMQITKKYNMDVLIDLHGAPGSQNLKAHSGSGNRLHHTVWLNNQEAKTQTIAVLVRLAKHYRHATNLWGVELINEPSPGYTGLKLAWFYRRAYRAIIPHLPHGVRVVFSDGYVPWFLTNTFGWSASKRNPVLMDSHVYYCFGRKNQQRPIADQLNRVRRYPLFLHLLQISQPVIIGEWSGALAMKAAKDQITDFIIKQQRSYEGSAATFYWSYKTEQNGSWNFRSMVERKQLRILRD